MTIKPLLFDILIMEKMERYCEKKDKEQDKKDDKNRRDYDHIIYFCWHYVLELNKEWEKV